jgi:hypothetical protein
MYGLTLECTPSNTSGRRENVITKRQDDGYALIWLRDRTVNRYQLFIALHTPRTSQHPFRDGLNTQSNSGIDLQIVDPEGFTVYLRHCWQNFTTTFPSFWLLISTHLSESLLKIILTVVVTAPSMMILVPLM